MSRAARLALAALSLGVLAGCGGSTRWERWQAERAAWWAHRQVERIRLQPALAGAAQWARAAHAYRSIAERWPVAEWAPRAAGDPRAREVAEVVGRAAVDAGGLEELRGRSAPALAAYTAAAEAWAPVEAVALDARLARARLLTALGRTGEARDAWTRVAAFAFTDPSTGAARGEVLDAPLVLARALAGVGAEGAADSVLRVAVGRYREALAAGPPGPVAVELWMRLGEACASLEDSRGALEALRQVLAVPGARDRAPRTVLLLAQRALDLQLPDSALVYARWAREGFDGAVRADGLRLTARAWEARGVPDSAVAAWGRLLDAYGGDTELAAEARSRRGMLLEGMGRWEQARSEYRALTASEATHPLAFEALVRIVAHHQGLGQGALARFEAARAIETLDRIIATQHDADVSFGARRTRARILELLGDAGAEQALAEVWRGAPDRPGAAQAGLSAARRAMARPGGRAAAESLYRDLAARAVESSVREAARAELERSRLDRARGDR